MDISNGHGTRQHCTRPQNTTLQEQILSSSWTMMLSKTYQQIERSQMYYRPQKPVPNRVIITVGGNLIEYPHEVTAQTADLFTEQLLWNSVVSTPNEKHNCVNVKILTSTHQWSALNTCVCQTNSSHNLF